MTDEAVVRVERVSKRFCRSLKQSLWYGVHDIAKELSGRGQQAEDLRPGEFWALRDVSFTVARGESVGLVGHNGAGKTTLLKLINGLIKPTSGQITVAGSVRALIALGTGFNPILTGRENVRIASAVLGYGNRQSEERLEEIIEFSELREFIDAPVQSYSSGMLARLGFAVAVHTRPDILLVDEVLAVGDLNFAIKCYRKIAEFRSEGGSIILVNHNPYAIRTNCDRVVWLEGGVVQAVGGVQEVCDAYELAVARRDAASFGEVHSDGTVQLVGIAYPEVVQSGDPFAIEVELAAARALEQPIVAITLATLTGQPVVASISDERDGGLTIREGRNVIRLTYDSLPLVRGMYSISVVVAETTMNDQRLAAVNRHRFEVAASGPHYGAGVVKLDGLWESDAGGVAERYAPSRSSSPA